MKIPTIVLLMDDNDDEREFGREISFSLSPSVRAREPPERERERESEREREGGREPMETMTLGTINNSRPS